MGRARVSRSGLPVDASPQTHERVLAWFGAWPRRRVLDCPAGEGALAHELIALGFSVVAAERGYHVEACDTQRALFKLPGIPFHQADLNASIPVPDASFDCAVSIEVLEHLEKHTRFMQELLRVTKVGGTIILTTPNVLSIPSRWHFYLAVSADGLAREQRARREAVAPRPSIPAGFRGHAEAVVAVARGLEGQLTAGEVRFLGLLAAVPTARGEVLEIGSFKRRSAIILAKSVALAGGAGIVGEPARAAPQRAAKERLLKKLNRLIPHVAPSRADRGLDRFLFEVKRKLVPHGDVDPARWLASLGPDA